MLDFLGGLGERLLPLPVIGRVRRHLTGGLAIRFLRGGLTIGPLQRQEHHLFPYWYTWVWIQEGRFWNTFFNGLGPVRAELKYQRSDGTIIQTAPGEWPHVWYDGDEIALPIGEKFNVKVISEQRPHQKPPDITRHPLVGDLDVVLTLYCRNVPLGVWQFEEAIVNSQAQTSSPRQLPLPEINRASG